MSFKIGDTRTTNDGLETCIDVQGEIAFWTLTTPSQSFLDRQAALQAQDQAREEAQANLEKIRQNREAYIDSLMLGDTASASKLQAAHADLISKGVTDGTVQDPVAVADDAAAAVKP